MDALPSSFPLNLSFNATDLALFDPLEAAFPPIIPLEEQAQFVIVPEEHSSQEETSSGAEDVAKPTTRRSRRAAPKKKKQPVKKAAPKRKRTKAIPADVSEREKKRILKNRRTAETSRKRRQERKSMLETQKVELEKKRAELLMQRRIAERENAVLKEQYSEEYALIKRLPFVSDLFDQMHSHAKSSHSFIVGPKESSPQQYMLDLLASINRIKGNTEDGMLFNPTILSTSQVA
mmetsp:Transcript_143043/g.202349  ORF Transcript_143043/g.202349 Transcript_143043/m.202349 type:complete len:234 (+) Transcript_143043:36-737(+)